MYGLCFEAHTWRCSNHLQAYSEESSVNAYTLRPTEGPFVKYQATDTIVRHTATRTEVPTYNAKRLYATVSLDE